MAARLHSVAIHLLRRVRRGDPGSGLTPSRLSVLSVLVFGGPRTPTELAEAEQVTGPTMTRLLRGLEADGYVDRTPSPTDGRSVIMSATPRARVALEEARGRRIRHMRELLEELSESEWRRLADATALLEAALRGERA